MALYSYPYYGAQGYYSPYGSPGYYPPYGGGQGYYPPYGGGQGYYPNYYGAPAPQGYPALPYTPHIFYQYAPGYGFTRYAAY